MSKPEPLKWAEVREHYMDYTFAEIEKHFIPQRLNRNAKRFTCRYCGKRIILELSRKATPSNDGLLPHLTEQHADKLKQGE